MRKWIIQTEDKKFLKKVFWIGTPVVIQNVLGALVNMLDVFMVGQLGEVAITASAMGGQWFTIFMLLCNGITAAGGTFIAQHWGQKKANSIHKYMGIMMMGAFALALAFGLVAFWNPAWIISLYSRDTKVIEAGITYIRINSIGYLFAAVTSVYAAALRSIGKTKVPMIGSLVSLAFKLVLNYMLIFGHFGMPELGIIGAALATIIARIVEMAIILVYAYGGGLPIITTIGNYFTFDRRLVGRFFRYGSFIVLGEGMYAVGTSIYSMIYKYAGTQSQAALQIAGTFQNISMVVSVAIGTASGVILGQMLGENKFEEARAYCYKFLRLAVVAAITVGGILILVSPHLLLLFRISSQSRTYVENILLIFAFSMPLRAINFMVLVGILRSGGDSFVCFLSNSVGTWLFGIPMAFLSVIVFKWPIHYIYALVLMDEVGKFVTSFPRVMSMKWMKNIVS